MRRLVQCLVVGAVLATTAATGALAAKGDPQRHLNVADQRWARSIRIRRIDLSGSRWQARTPRVGLVGKGCRRPDESDLVLTGIGRDAELVRPGAVVASEASIYASAAQANAAWQRGQRRPIFRCLRGALQRLFSAPGAKVVVRGTARLRQSGPTLLTAGYRVRFDVRGPQGAFRGRLGYFRVTRGRALAVLLVMTFTQPVEPVPAAEERRLLRLVEQRANR